MSNYMNAKGDTINDSLQHGLGKGSGRGRPLGSKNGQVMPGAAYMKDYQIVGQKAVGLNDLPAGRGNGGSGAAPSYTSNAARRRVPAAGSSSANKSAAVKVANPAASVDKGKQFVSQMIGEQNDTAEDKAQTQDNPRATLKENLEAAKENVLTENTIPEKILIEDTITEKSPEEANSNDTSTSEQKGIFESVGDWLGSAASTIGNAVSGAWNSASSAVSEAVDTASKWVGEKLGEVGSWASTAASDVWNGGADIIDRVFGTDLNNNGVTGQSGWQGAERALQNAGQWLDQNIAQPVSRAANTAGEWIGDTAGNVWNGIQNAGNAVGQFAGNVWNGGVDALDRLAGTDLNNNGVTGQPGLQLQGVRDALAPVGQGIRDAANTAWNGIQNAGNAVSQFAGNAWNGVQNALGTVRDAAGNALNSGVDTVDRLLGTDLNGNGVTGQAGWQGAERALAPIRDGAVNALNSVRDGVGNLGQAVGNAANSVGQFAGNAWNGVQNAVGTVGDAANTAWNGVRDGVGNIGQWIGNTSNNVVDAVDNFIGTDLNGNGVTGNGLEDLAVGARDRYIGGYRPVYDANGNIAGWTDEFQFNGQIPQQLQNTANNLLNGAIGFRDRNIGGYLPIRDENGNITGWTDTFALGNSRLGQAMDRTFGQHDVIGSDPYGNVAYGQYRNGTGLSPFYNAGVAGVNAAGGIAGAGANLLARGLNSLTGTVANADANWQGDATVNDVIQNNQAAQNAISAGYDREARQVIRDFTNGIIDSATMNSRLNSLANSAQ